MTTMSLRVKYTFLEFCEVQAEVSSSRSLSAPALHRVCSSSLSPEEHVCGATIAPHSAFGKKRWADYEEDDASTDISSDQDSLERTTSQCNEALSCDDTSSVSSRFSDPLDVSQADVVSCVLEQHSDDQQPLSWEHGAEEWGWSQQQCQQQQAVKELKQHQKHRKQNKQKQQEQQPRQQLIPTHTRQKSAAQQVERHAQAPCQLELSKQSIVTNQNTAAKSEVVSNPLSRNGIKETAVMIRNIPCSFIREDVITTLNNLGFKDTFDVVFLPMTVTFSANFGYVFVNFFEMHHADQLSRVLQGVNFSATDAEKRCEVAPAKEHGRANMARHLRRYNAKCHSMPTDVFSKISDKPHDLFE